MTGGSSAKSKDVIPLVTKMSNGPETRGGFGGLPLAVAQDGTLLAPLAEEEDVEFSDEDNAHAVMQPGAAKQVWRCMHRP